MPRPSHVRSGLDMPYLRDSHGLSLAWDLLRRSGCSENSESQSWQMILLDKVPNGPVPSDKGDGWYDYPAEKP